MNDLTFFFFFLEILPKKKETTVVFLSSLYCAFLVPQNPSLFIRSKKIVNSSHFKTRFGLTFYYGKAASEIIFAQSYKARISKSYISYNFLKFNDIKGMLLHQALSIQFFLRPSLFTSAIFCRGRRLSRNNISSIRFA